MKRILILFALFAVAFTQNVFAADTIQFSLKITGVKISKGKIYVALYSSEQEHKKDIPYANFVLESKTEKMMHTFEIAEGEYLIAIFQDTNNNGALDANFFGYPKEPVGMSNYNGGIPEGFKKQKIPISKNSKTTTINVRKL